MKLTLLIPSLFWPDRHDALEVLSGLSLPALSSLLGAARRTAKNKPLSSIQATRAGLSSLAPARWLAADYGLDSSTGHWLLADPAHLRVNRDRAHLADSGIMNLTQSEADALLSSLNALLQEDGMRLYAPHPARWFLHMPAPAAASFTPLADAIGEDVNRLLPSGEKGLIWCRLLNELQMLLYAHPVNDAREARGEPALNSLWLWGEGDDQKPAFCDIDLLFSDDALMQAMASHAAMPCDAVPYTWSALLEICAQNRVEVHLERLLAPARYRDAWGWREAVQQLEADWFAPLWAALRSGLLSELSLITDGPNGFEAKLSRADTWKFWRRPCALEKLLNEN
ncbi:hypothetical protein [Craterilacuibacter sp. RT1T]|uniref:hypothetical protein n=1 Tax=Craterilacuibacter sp. RT1T TaxID=2942211 RepID=UPI0020C1199A|nr:hypothetical protein [Craterilacuibacter sp. RT1T]MCL6263211.1 hypothetical protein [Craterilacuibacter sp. RT1T]